jgi:hypothetical protein
VLTPHARAGRGSAQVPDLSVPMDHSELLRIRHSANPIRLSSSA